MEQVMRFHVRLFQLKQSRNAVTHLFDFHGFLTHRPVASWFAAVMEGGRSNFPAALMHLFYYQQGLFAEEETSSTWNLLGQVVSPTTPPRQPVESPGVEEIQLPRGESAEAGAAAEETEDRESRLRSLRTKRAELEAKLQAGALRAENEVLEDRVMRAQEELYLGSSRASLGTCSEQAMSVLGISQDFLGLQAEFKSMKEQHNERLDSLRLALEEQQKDAEQADRRVVCAEDLVRFHQEQRRMMASHWKQQCQMKDRLAGSDAKIRYLNLQLTEYTIDWQQLGVQRQTEASLSHEHYCLEDLSSQRSGSPQTSLNQRLLKRKPRGWSRASNTRMLRKLASRRRCASPRSASVKDASKVLVLRTGLGSLSTVICLVPNDYGASGGIEVCRLLLPVFGLFSQIEAELWIALAMGGYLSGRFEASVAAVVKEVLREHSTIVQPSEISNADEAFYENQLMDALKKEGMETCNLILGIDFTRSNLTQGKETFHNLSLHALGSPHGPNPYQRSIDIVMKTLAPMFDEDGLVPAFIFGDVSTKDRAVRPLVSGHDSILVDEILPAYNKAVEKLGVGGYGLSGPTSFAPLIYKAIEVVSQNGNEQHILLILADGAVTDDACCEATRQALVLASDYPLSIVMIGVGDGPWDVMKEFDDALPSRFVPFAKFQALLESGRPRQCRLAEAAFALCALQEVPAQRAAMRQLGLFQAREPPAKRPRLFGGLFLVETYRCGKDVYFRLAGAFESQLEKITAQLERTDSALRSAQVALATQRAKHQEMKTRHGDAESKLREAQGSAREVFGLALRRRRWSRCLKEAWKVRHRFHRHSLPLKHFEELGQPCSTLGASRPMRPVPVALRLPLSAQLRSCSDRAAVGDPSLAARSLQAVQALHGSIMVRHADAEGAARVLNACSRSPLPDETAVEVARLYVERATKLLPQSNTRHMATVVNAMARSWFHQRTATDVASLLSVLDLWGCSLK
eukprot:s6137_g2.t2